MVTTVMSLCPPTWVTHAWTNPRMYRYDNIGWSVLALFEFSFQESWSDGMYALGDLPDQEGHQPQRDNNPANMLFSITWMVIGTRRPDRALTAPADSCGGEPPHLCGGMHGDRRGTVFAAEPLHPIRAGSLFLINLWGGVLCEQYIELKSQNGGVSMFLTKEQEDWVRVHKLAITSKPIRSRRPRSWPLTRVYDLVMSPAFEKFIMLIIVLNTLIMALEHRHQSSQWDSVLVKLNDAFAFVFVTEAVLKFAAFGVRGYFMESWNIFDLAIVCISMAGVVVSYVSSAKTSFLSVLRVLRVARVFRLIPKAKALRSLFSTLIISIPAFANVTSVLLLFYFVYSVAGMNLFGHIKEDNQYLFRHGTCPRSCLLPSRTPAHV